jgi:hypothetical protein
VKDKTHINHYETVAKAADAERSRKHLRVQTHVKAGPTIINDRKEH